MKEPLLLLIFCAYSVTVICQSYGPDQDLIQGPAKPLRIEKNARMDRFNNFTRIINNLLDPTKYDKKLRPNFGEGPTYVTVDINIRSMGPISELNSIFQFDCYFRQKWVDRRLSYNNANITEMLLSTHTLYKMWRPDTYIVNGRGSYLHTITVPNMFVRIAKDGTVIFSQRLTIRTLCQMQLRRYPLDYQTCTAAIGSFGYQNKDLIYLWKTADNNSVSISEGISMSQFELLSISVADFNLSRTNTSAKESILEASFHMKRATGFYLLNVYIPCGMLVAVSWVAFWLNREASGARCVLGITTVLTTVTIGMSGRQDLPKLDYLTALDLYLLLSLVYVLAAFIEFAGVNYFTKITKPDDCKPAYAFKPEELLPPPPRPKDEMPDHSILKKFLFCLTGDVQYRALLKQYRNEMNSVSVIDTIARFIFPLTFFILNIVYWVSYIFYLVNEEPR